MPRSPLRIGDDVHDSLRRAARAFADELYGIFVGALEKAAAESSADAAPNGHQAGSHSTMARVVTFIRTSPGALPRDIVRALRVRRVSVFEALHLACAQGLLQKEGRGRAVRYTVTNAEETGPVSSTRKRARKPRYEDLVERIVPFVTENPGCRFSQLATALSGGRRKAMQNALAVARRRGLVRMEGERNRARYYCVEVLPLPELALSAQ